MPLVTSKKMLHDAYAGGYAVGAFNINNMEILQAITEACDEAHSPVILQASNSARKYAHPQYLVDMVHAACEEHPYLPIVLHLDHGDSFETCCRAIDDGFTSVMIDLSSRPFEENVRETHKVVEYAHARGVDVEAELGALAGIEDEVNVSEEDSHYTHPEQVQEFVSRTGCDSLAVAIGTSHGAYKFKPGTDIHLRFDILDRISSLLPGFPIVLHGASTIPQKYVEMINQYGGNIPDAIGVPENQLRIAAQKAVCKINIDSDLRLTMTGSVRKYFATHPEKFDPRAYLGYARDNIRDIVTHDVRDIFRCAGRVS